MSDDARVVVEAWLARFNAAAADAAPQKLAGLLLEDSHWRDAAGLSWELFTVSGRDAVTRKLADALKAFQARDFAIDSKRCPPDRGWTLHTALNDIRGHEQE